MIMQIEEEGKKEWGVGDIVTENSNHLRKKGLEKLSL